MEKQNKHLDFSNQQFYIGIDVHKRNWTVTIRSNKMVLKTFSMNPDPKELISHMERNYPGGKYYSVYEAGYSGYWIHRELTEKGIKNKVVSPTEIPTSSREKLTKTDKVDSRKLARELGNDSFRGIYIPTVLEQELRSLCRLRYQQVRKQTRIKNQIKSYLNFYGHKLPENCEMKHWSRKFIEHLRELNFEYAMGKEQLEIYIEELITVRTRLTRIIKSIKNHFTEQGKEKEIKLLRSVPGIGFLTAITLLAELITIERFSSIDKLAGYLGLIPSTRSSGEKDNVLGISILGNRYLRYLLIESAWTAIRHDPALTLAYNNYLRRMSKQKAIIRIAKKLLSRIIYVWKNEKEYVYSVVQ
ncbi:MAG: IS110 family transposase [Candidatus Hydrogenedentota bacterium]